MLMLKMAVLVPAVRNFVKSRREPQSRQGRRAVQARQVSKSTLIPAFANLARDLRVRRDSRESLLNAAGLEFEFVRAKDPKTKFGKDIYCEHPMLSLQHPGDVVKMLKVVDPSQLGMMTPEILQDFLDCACVLFDFRSCRPVTEPQRWSQARLLQRSQDPDKTRAVCDVLRQMGLEDGPETGAQLRTLDDTGRLA